MEWYQISSDEALSKLDTDGSTGLSQSEAESRLEKYGPNELKEGKKKSFARRLLEEFMDPMIIILLLAAIVSAFAGEKIDSIIILAIVIINAVLSLTQEGKAAESIEALKKISAPTVRVIRDGQAQEVDSTGLVPGDIVMLETGDIVPADLRLLESTNLQIDESSLTGESVAVEKYADTVLKGEHGIGDRANLAFSASIVTYGRGTGVVVGTGTETEIGKIATSLSDIEDSDTPLQKRLAGLSKSLGILVVVVCIIVFGVGKFYGHETTEMFLTAISLAVAAIPEGLAAIVTIVLSLGMTKMANEHAIVKKLLAVETLGTTTYICSDKTGTLTQNEMTVTKAYVDGKIFDVSGTGYEPTGGISHEGQAVEEFKELNFLTAVAGLTNDAQLVKDGDLYKILGDPTEGALLTFIGKLGETQEGLTERHPRVAEIPFDSDRKMMTTFHKDFMDHEVISFTKGAPDIVLDRCDSILIGGEIKPLTPEIKEEILKQNSSFARQALRVLAFAFQDHDNVPQELESESIETGLTFIGLTGMIDPPREEARQAIKECKQAGIVPVMITGDYLETATAIGKDLGIITEDDQAIMGKDLNDKSDEEIQEIVNHIRVFARVSPQNKVQIVKALQDNGEIVAMTGDGVNDAPAIKMADIGIAMGITGTDVAKTTAEVILTDDNFATIVGAVEEGRVIYSNIKKFVSFLLSCNIGEVLIVLLAIIMNLPTPFLPIQLLWLNLVTDSFPALALGVEKGEAGIMNEPPRQPDEPILDKNVIITILIQSLSITAVTLGIYIFALRRGVPGDHDIIYARTMAFATLIMAEFLRSYSGRSFHDNLWEIGFFSNKRLVQGTFVSFLLMVAVMYFPFLEKLFHLTDIGFKDWLLVIGASLIPLIIGEIQKFIRFEMTDKEMY